MWNKQFIFNYYDIFDNNPTVWTNVYLFYITMKLIFIFNLRKCRKTNIWIRPLNYFFNPSTYRYCYKYFDAYIF